MLPQARQEWRYPCGILPSLAALGMRADESSRLLWVDVWGTHLDPGGLFLQQKRDATILLAPAAVHGLDGDLLGEIGDGHRHVVLAAQLGRQGNVFAGQGQRK